MFGRIKAWRRQRVLDRAEVPEAAWQAILDEVPLFRGLSPDERERLRRWVVLFLHEKQVHGAAGLEVSEEMRLTIAAQACLPILNLDLDYYRGWVEVIVYPEEFVPMHEYTDEAGVVHVTRHPLAGEAWLSGPVILSWADVDYAGYGEGYNVVIHEFAHKLDMLNGGVNGFPPLHADMSRQAWTKAFRDAYEDFCARVDSHGETPIDPYAAESPGEFFAVMSEAFFETPEVVKEWYPEVYAQLAAFYRQDPAARLAAAQPRR